MFIWFNTLFSHFCVTEKSYLRVGGDRERRNEFIEETSVGSVNCVEEKAKRGRLSLREWCALDEFGEENGVLE